MKESRSTEAFSVVKPTSQRLSHMLAPTPDWKHLYIPNLGSNTLSLLNTTTDEIEKHISVGRKPEGVAVHPSGAFLYVANQDENNLYVMSTEHHGILAKHPIGDLPVRLIFSPNGRLACTANRNSHDVSVIDAQRHWEIKRIPVGRWPGVDSATLGMPPDIVCLLHRNGPSARSYQVRSVTATCIPAPCSTQMSSPTNGVPPDDQAGSLW